MVSLSFPLVFFLLFVFVVVVIVLRTRCTIDRICAELIRGLWDSEDLRSSPSANLAVVLRQFGPFFAFQFSSVE